MAVTDSFDGRLEIRGGETLGYSVTGPSDAQDVILLHGLGTTRVLWAKGAALLAKTFRVISLDFPGHGESACLEGALTLSDLVALVVELCDHLGCNAPWLAGVSLGSIVALASAAAHPMRFGGVIALGSAQVVGTAVGWRERGDRVRNDGTEWLVDSLTARWVGATRAHSDPTWRDFVAAELAKVDKDAYSALCDTLAQVDLSETLSAIRIPVVVMNGQDDEVTTPGEGELLARCVPGARFISLEGAAHLPVLTHIDEVVSLIRTALSHA